MAELKTYTQAQPDEILRNHKHWILEDIDGWEDMQADLSRADLFEADLFEANLSRADLSRADLFEAKNVPFVPMACPDTGGFIGWKKARGKIVKLRIPEDARRSSATGRKCRCDKAMRSRERKRRKTDGTRH